MDGQELVKQTLDQIPQANSNVKHIVELVKEGAKSPHIDILTIPFGFFNFNRSPHK